MAPGIITPLSSDDNGSCPLPQVAPATPDFRPAAAEPIAVVGMACRLPGNVSSPSDLWRLLAEKRTGYREFDSSRFNIDGYYHPNPARPGSINTRGGHLLDCDPHLFDHAFFSMPSTEVLTLDPMQRKLVEVSYEAMESAGEPWEKFSGSRTGVFVGNFCTDYYLAQMSDMDFAPQYTPTGAGASILSNRVNHLLNLKGPSLTVDTACASSMYALHLAVNAIRAGDCDAAIVGGSNIILSQTAQQLTGLLGALSGTSLCHTFDEAADGYSRAEGFCALYLKRCSDAIEGEYPIRAVIRGTAINSNGKTAGISHPGADGQEALIRQAYRNAGLPTHLTGYFECHGTGTPVGDPVEVSAVAKVFSPERGEEPLLIGSVKTNLGHSEAASGITGVMKSILALEKGMIPATVGIQRLNPSVDFDGSRVRVVTEMTPWPEGLLRRVSVNSFGFGGANGHCILDHPETLGLDRSVKMPFRTGELQSRSEVPTRRLVLLPFSAHDQEALSSNIVAIQRTLPSLPLADVAYTLSNRRSRFLHKTFAIVEPSSTDQELTVQPMPASKTAATQSARVGFVFTGQGAQWQDMGCRLFEYRVFRVSIESQDAALASLSIRPTWTLREVLCGESKRSVEEAEVSQTACTALQIALVDLLRSWNISPHASVGHSSGEMAAAYAAGLITLPEAIVTAYCRGKSISTNTQDGAMLAVGLGFQKAMDLLEGEESAIRVAAVNSPSSVTLSGDADAIRRIAERLRAKSIFARLLQTGGNAYHSHHMLALGEEYQTMLEKSLSELHSKGQYLRSCHWVSSVTPHKAAVVTPAYWRQNLESAVRFSSAIERLVEDQETQVDILVEIGPHSALRGPLKQILSKAEAENDVNPPVYLTALKRFEDGMRNLLGLCGSLYQLNHNVDLGAVNSVDREGFPGTEYVHGKVCTELPSYQYSYGPVIFYEHRAARELRHRQTLHHDLLGVLQAGGAKDQPMWRNMLRLKQVPWLNDHQLTPNAVLPGAAYVCIGIEAASQFISARNGMPVSPLFKLRNVSIKNALRIPEGELGVEMVTNLSVSSFSSNWLQFNVASVDNDGTWTENASGLVSISKSLLSESSSTKRIDARIDPRDVDISGWYSKFTEIGLGYGPSFQALSKLQTDPHKGIASAELALNTTKGMFVGPESKYAIHPSSLDACFQLALIAVYGGHTGRAKHGFIPVSIDEMSVWPSAHNDEWGQAVAQGRITGLRGAHAKVQIFDQSGKPMLELNDLGCVSYYGGAGKDKAFKANEYVRLVWKPDISTLRNQPEALNFSSTFKKSPRQAFVNLIDLIGHRNPGIKVLQVGSGTGEVSETILQTLRGDTMTKRYDTYTLADNSKEALNIMKHELSDFKKVDFRFFDIEQAPGTQGVDGTYDLVIVTEGLKGLANPSLALRHLRALLDKCGKLVLLESALGSDQWQPVLETTGFSGVDIEWAEAEHPHASGLVSTAVEPMAAPICSDHLESASLYVIYHRHISPFHEALADELRKRHTVPVIAALGSATSIPHRSRVVIAVDLESEGLVDLSKEMYESLQALTKSASSMLWLTKGGVITAQDPYAAIGTGFMRMLTSEKMETKFGVFHLEGDFMSTRREAAKLLLEREQSLRHGDQEHEVALHNGVLYIPRLVYDTDLNERYEAINSSSKTLVDLPLHSQGPMEIHFGTPGLLTSAYFRRDESLDSPLPADCVEIKTAATGLNWKDLAVATGRNDMDECSSDTAGTVTVCGSAVTHLKPGDRVCALAWSKFNTTIRLPAGLAQPMSAEDSFDQMSTVPIPYCTAIYAFLHLARLRKGDKVLIQTATGGLGLAAIQVAKHCHADIFATVGTPEKSAYLREQYGIPEDRIFSSRDENDVPAMIAASGGKGFDVILSSSVGDMLHATWRCIAPRGHFIDVGRLDVQKRSTIGMEVYERNATFSSFDLSTMTKQDPDFSVRLMQEVGSMLRAKAIKPITELQTFDIADLHTAMLSFSQGKHIGKFVISYENPDSVVKMLPPTPRATFNPEAEYIFVGGLGGLGRSMLRWFVDRGARHFTIFSRSGSRNGEAQVTIEDLEASGATVTLKAVDIASRAQVDATVAEVARTRPIRGIVHAAAGFDSGIFEQMPYSEWQQGLAAKVHGTVNLHDASVSQRLPLDFFVMTSSIQTMFALPAQAAYCAGNAFQDAFARYRRSIGLPACAIGFGLITEISKVGKSYASSALMRRHQMSVCGEYEFLQSLEAAFLEAPVTHEGSDSWRFFDGLANAQMLAYGDPRKLAAEYRNDDDPPWRKNLKFAHIVRATNDHLSALDQPVQVKAGRPAAVEAVDAAIGSGNRQKAVTTTAKAIAERTAALLAVDAEIIDPSRSVAEYGVDSLIAVELRSWIVAAFENTLPLLKLLDERVNIVELAEYVVEERIQKLSSLA